MLNADEFRTFILTRTMGLIRIGLMRLAVHRLAMFITCH